MSPSERALVMSRFKSGTVLVATNCFGLGVDIPDIRLVVHYGLPRSLLGYAQECGRAGRDGYKATCILFMKASDISKYNDNERDVKLASDMLTWTNDLRCRHMTLLRSFGETVTNLCCTWTGKTTPNTETASQSASESQSASQSVSQSVSQSLSESDTSHQSTSHQSTSHQSTSHQSLRGCDVCADLIDVVAPIQHLSSDDIRLLLQAIVDTGNHSGSGLPIAFLLGSKSKKLVRFIHNMDCVYNRGRHKTRNDWINIHRQLITTKLLREVITSRGFIVYKITVNGLSFL
jgi:superfamily II DNA helicase RecQ